MQTVHLQADMELERQQAEELAWEHEVTMLSDREQSGVVASCVDGLEAVDHGDSILMDDGHSGMPMQSFSLLMMAPENSQSGLPQFPLMMMGPDIAQSMPDCAPSTVLSLQTMASASDASGGEERVGPKKRGRQKGPGKPRSHYQKERESSFQLVLKLPLKSRKLFCVAEFYKYMAQSSSDSLCKVTEAYSKAGESVGVSAKTARKWVEDWERRADGTFSESMQGKHVKVEWLLQPEHLQNKARAWIEQNCPKKGDPPRKESIIKMFRDFCNNELLVEIQNESGIEADCSANMHRKISTETARSWLHRLGFNNFKDFRRSVPKTA